MRSPHAGLMMSIVRQAKPAPRTAIAAAPNPDTPARPLRLNRSPDFTLGHVVALTTIRLSTSIAKDGKVGTNRANTALRQRLGRNNAVMGDSEYVVAYDYGTGGVWAVMTGPSKYAIESAYPDLHVVEEAPSWMDAARYDRLKGRTGFRFDRPDDYWRHWYRPA
jgi:hypothetical protein